MQRFILLIVLGVFASTTMATQRLKDVAGVAGVRPNQLSGFGLVVGLDGTGDQTTQTPFVVQAFLNMLKQHGLTPPPGVTPQLKNVAAVSVVAELPAFAKPGQALDITVLSLGNAKSLRGGTLLMTPLKGIDNNVYAIAQGHLVVGGFGAEGADGSRITVNVPSAGRVPGGATVERPAPNGFMHGDIIFNLHRPSFTTAKNIVDAVNRQLGPEVANAMDGVSVRVSAPIESNDRVSFVSFLENLKIEEASMSARVVINSRTGTIIVSENVEVAAAAVTHGSLTVTISEATAVSQPNPFGEGETAVVPQSEVEITEADGRMFRFEPGVTLEDIVSAVNQVGAAPGDLMAILEGLKQAGALRAELIVI